MAAKLLHSLADDNLELQKQIGCMNGIYQLFDRHHILTSGRHTHKPLHQDQDYNPQREANHEHLRSQNFTEKIAVKNVQEKQRISNASPRASFSSLSRSSSSSSLDCIRASQLEFSSLDRTRESSSPQFSRHIRDLVKDSMYRKNSEIMNGVDTKQGIDDDVKVSVRAAEAPRHHTEGRRLIRSLSYHSRDDYPSLITRDAPRFSCDGREVKLDLSKSTLKLKDLPRLSLDGRPTSVQQDSGGKLQQSARPPSVVAKLMGLETLPHSIDNNSSVTKSYQDKDFIHKSRPFAEREANKLWKEPNSPRWRSPDSSMKPLSRFPLEPAPWKHNEGRRSSQKPRPKTTRGAAKAETAFPSVYSEIEKRLKDLEFTQSGKDLRALKQILEAMQSKKALQTQKQDHGEKQLRPKQEARSVDLRKPHAEEPTKRATVASRHAASPIVIMKPASSKSSQHESAVTWSANVKNDTTLKATQISTRSQNLVKDGNAGLGKSSGSISPRLIQKKLELEKRARPPTPPDTTKLRRQPSKQLGESNSPGGRRRPKHSNIQESGEKLGENENMVRSNASFPRTSPSREEAMLTDSITTLASNGVKSTEFGIVLIEHSSPVSVLDNRIHAEDSPSSLTYKVEKEKDSNMVRGSCADSSIPSWREYGFTSEMNQNKLQNIENLVEKLRRLNSNHDQAGTDYIASLCANTSDPDQRYISEILLASGVLLGSTPTDFQFHPSGHPINPELFLVLEQTKVSSVLKEACTTPDKRKLVFDTVNEILGRKLLPTGPWLRQLTQSRTAMNAQKLLRELCSEIEALQGSRSGEEDERWKGVVWGDVMHRESTCWTGFDDEISGAVLDIERSIFKDLVNEIVIGEAAAAAAASGLKIKPAGRRRPFAKQ